MLSLTMTDRNKIIIRFIVIALLHYCTDSVKVLSKIFLKQSYVFVPLNLRAFWIATSSTLLDVGPTIIASWRSFVRVPNLVR